MYLDDDCKQKNKKYVAECECHYCSNRFTVEFELPPTEEDKMGWICDECFERSEAEVDW